MPSHGPPGNPHDLPAEAPTSIVPSRDLKPLADEADRLIGTVADAVGAEGEMPPEGDIPLEGEMPAEGPVGEAGVDLTPLIETLGVDEIRAQELWDAAQQMPRLQGVDPAELAMLLADDIQLRMQVEGLAAGTADQAAMAAEEAAMIAPPPEAAMPEALMPEPTMPIAK